MSVFRRLLWNALVSGVMSSFLWFALTFWVYLETRSVLTTSVIGGAFSVFSAFGGMLFGTYVDRHRKHTSMVVASVTGLAFYGAAALQYLLIDQGHLLRLSSPWFWLFVALILAGSVVGNLRSIALSTTVSLLVPEDSRDRANGMIGAAMGVSFTITSVISGLVVGQLGMGWAMAIAVVVTALALGHLLTIHVEEAEPERASNGEPERAMDFSGAWHIIRDVPGLTGLIAFAAFNNLVGGVFMALMDAYGLSLVSVEVWGALFAVISLGFVAGGVYVAKKGLGSRPMRVILLGNAVNWTVCTVFTFRSSIVLLAIGMLVWMTLMPAIEAAEQTVLQRVVPFAHQGRVFGFAQTAENSAAPLTAFMVGPLAQLVFIPFMDEGGRGADLIGGWFGVGQERGLALIFTLAGIIGIIATVAAGRARWFRLISSSTDAGTPDAGTPDAGTPDAGTPDAGTLDAGTPDGGSPGAGEAVSGTLRAAQ